MDENWPKAFSKTETFEGWHLFSNDPADPGGATYDGVTQKTYDAWRRLQKLPTRSVHLMTDAECSAIMEGQFWTPAHCGELWAGLDVLAYDISVNCGPSRAIRMVQQAVGVKADGVFGLHTRDAVRSVNDQQALLKKIATIRLSFWHRLTTWWRFGKGWSSRGEGSLAFALEVWKSSAPGGIPATAQGKST